MTIENCPKCGGTHIGSYDCPITNPAKTTPWPAPPSQTTQDDDETVRIVARFENGGLLSKRDTASLIASWRAALRQRADEATRVENEACATLQIGSGVPATNESASVFASGFRVALEMYRDAIRARITPKAQIIEHPPGVHNG